jgi:hypothetical protein
VGLWLPVTGDDLCDSNTLVIITIRTLKNQARRLGIIAQVSDKIIKRGQRVNRPAQPNPSATKSFSPDTVILRNEQFNWRHGYNLTILSVRKS